MKIDFWKRPFWAPEDGAGGGGDTPPGGSGNDTPPAGSGNDIPPAGAGGDTPPAGGEAAKWWEDGKRFSEAQRSSLTALGLTVDDPLDALPKLLDMEANAKKRLGASPDQLMQKPKDGQDVSEWLRENGDLFGIPKDADGYQVDRPEGWPKDASWDEGLEAEARKIALEEGLSGKALNRFVGLYAGKLQALEGGAADQLAASSQQMMAELSRDWGDQLAGKVTQAQQAFQLISQQAGMDDAARMSAAQVLTEKAGGDANVLRMFAAIGEMMGEDSLTGLNAGGGAGLTTTPADARAKLEAMKASDSEYRKQSRLKTEGKPNNFDALHKEFLALQKLANG